MFQKGLVLAVLSLVLSVPASAVVKVAVVKSWGNDVLPIYSVLNNYWSSYGTTPLTIDTSLRSKSFTYEDLVNTNADVLWLSDPSGGQYQYSAEEFAAVEKYVKEGHSILGTYMAFQFSLYDNRTLAPLFGLRQDINYDIHSQPAENTFQILTNHSLFNSISNPYISGGYPNAQVPASDLKWDTDDLGTAQLLAKTSDNRGIITWYETPSYHAIYISKMVEWYGGQMDTQLLYNALTIPEPATLSLLLGGITAHRRKRK